MEDFEYSVEICDRDWECFFAECEECNLLPPSLAGVDDSGMSDIDDTGSIHLKKVQKYNLTAGFSEADHPIDGPPDCEGSPVEDYLSKYGVSGMESVLSGSEEDIHLQSVNIFFERLKNVTEAERLAEPNQVRAGENREAIKEEEQYSDGQQSSSSMPKNIPKLNSLPARGETAVGKETMMPVDSIRNINTMKKIKPGSNVSPEAASSNSILKTNKSTYPETELFIREEACTDVNEVTQQNLSHDSLERVVCSQTPLHTDEVMQVEMYSPLKDVQLTSQPPLSDKCNTNSSSNLKMTNGQWKEEQNPAVLQLDATCIIKSASQESSPSASVKRKRRRRRRLSFEPSDSSHGYERQVLAQQSDSEEGQYAGKGGTSLCLSEDVDLLHLNEPHKNIVSSLYSVASNLPLRISRKQMKANDLSHTVPPCQYLPESITSSAENNATITALGQIDDGVMSAADNSGNMLINLQPCARLEVEELTRLNKYPWLSVSVSATLTGQSDLNGETANGEVNQSITGGGSEQNLKCCTAEVKSISHRITSSTESNDRSVDFRQNDKLFTAKAVLAVEAGNAGRDSHTPCQRKAEPQEQLEIDCHDTDQYSSTLEKTCGLNTKPQEFKTKAFPLLEETSYKETCAKFTSDCISSSPDERCLCKRPPSLDMNNTEQQTEDPLEIQTLSKLDILSGEKTQLAVSQLMASVCQTGEINSTGSSQRETKLSMSEDSITNPSDIRPLSSCCTLDTESVRLLSNGFIKDLSGSQNESVSQGEKITQILAKHEEGDAKSAFKSHFITNDLTESKFDVLGGEEDAVTSSKAEHTPKKAPDSKRSVFAMSSFWSEMEKLTINDILHLRTSKAAPPISPSPVPESEEINMFAATDSGFFTQLNESNSVQTDDDISSLPDFVESSLGCVKPLDSSSGVMWESEPVPVSHDLSIYPENMMLTHESHISQPFVSGRSQKSLRKISKNVSVQNLHALESESFNSTWRGQTLQTLDEGESEKAEYFSDEHMPKQDKDMDSLLKDSYKISVMDIFQYFFGGKQSIPSQSATDNTTTFYTDGNSLPETYDHFFSEFDTESFFSPFNTAEDQTKDKLVPIFSYSRSANRNLQFPEAYDYFFESSSTDDSSVESDGEDDCSPVRVVTRFSRKSSASQISTDIYDNFFTDNDLRQNFFWKTMLSFRNINFAGSAVQKQCLSRSLSQVNVRPSGRSLRRTVYPSNVLGNQDVIFPDPLLYHLEDRMLRQQAQHPLIYEDLQTAVSNPRLDASLLPLRQSDMCLVCIAFASWVLKTANPQVGDAWKAVLLANVSALSAIRYLRKYVKMETAAGEKKPNGSTPSES